MGLEINSKSYPCSRAMESRSDAEACPEKQIHFKGYRSVLKGPFMRLLNGAALRYLCGSLNMASGCLVIQFPAVAESSA